MSAVESGTWVLLIQTAQRQSTEQVKAMMAPPESEIQAVARVKRQMGDHGGVEVAHQVISLKDPMSGKRMNLPARFEDASGLQAFDLESFLSLAERNRKWQDPTTLQNSTVKRLQMDTFVRKVLECLASFPHAMEVEVNSEGLWRPDGSTGGWFSICTPPDKEKIAAALASSTRESLDPGGPRGKAHTRTAENGDVVVNTDSETDEEEELRKAAAAVKPAAVTISGYKRKEPEPEIIDLLSSDDEERSPRRPIGGPRAGGPSASSAKARAVSAARSVSHAQGSAALNSNGNVGEISPRLQALRDAAAGHMDGRAAGYTTSPLTIRLKPQGAPRPHPPPPRPAPPENGGPRPREGAETVSSRSFQTINPGGMTEGVVIWNPANQSSGCAPEPSHVPFEGLPGQVSASFSPLVHGRNVQSNNSMPAPQQHHHHQQQQLPTANNAYLGRPEMMPEVPETMPDINSWLA